MNITRDSAFSQAFGIADTIPTSLTAIPQWVADRNRKPVNPKKGKFSFAKTNDPDTWSDYAQASHFAERRGLGLAFMFTPELNLTLFELENCLTPQGHLSPFAAECVEYLDTYTEVSRSGRGLHFVIRGSVPRNVNNQAQGFEFFNRSHACNITGNRWIGTPAEPQERQEQLTELFNRLCPPKPEGERGETVAVDLPDDSILRKMFTGKNGQRLQALWDGDVSEYPSHSEADQALCNALSFWTGRDAERIDALFRQSGLYREKWDTKHYGDGRTYGQETIENALGVSKVYKPEYNPNPCFDGTVPDILKFARQFASQHTFTGRRAELSRQCALGAISVLEKANSLESPISTRYLAVASGTNSAAAHRALSGDIHPKTRERTTTPDTLANWLLQRAETGNGIAANVYRLWPEIVALYRDTAETVSHKEVHTVDFLCDTVSAVSRIISTNMTDDAYARPSFKKGFRRKTEHQKPAEGWDAIDVKQDDCVRLFGALGASIMETLLSRDSATIDDVATAIGSTISDTAQSIILLRKTYPGLIVLTPPVTRSTVLALPADIETRLTAILGKANRLIGLSRLMNTAVDDDPGLKSFTPIGLAIVAHLEAHGDLCISDLAKRLDKHTETIKSAVDRMGIYLVKNGLEPIVETRQSETDKRKTAVHLHADWQKRVVTVRPHLCTDGINQQRNVAYAMERLGRVRRIAETARHPETLAMIGKIQTGANAVLDWTSGKVNPLHQQLEAQP